MPACVESLLHSLTTCGRGTTPAPFAQLLADTSRSRAHSDRVTRYEKTRLMSWVKLKNIADRLSLFLFHLVVPSTLILEGHAPFSTISYRAALALLYLVARAGERCNFFSFFFPVFLPYLCEEGITNAIANSAAYTHTHAPTRVQLLACLPILLR